MLTRRLCQKKNSFNSHANDGTPWNYPGGTALTINCISRANHVNNRIDFSGLGRWTWICLEGRLNTFVNYISVYQPCFNKIDVTSTWNQHVRYFNDKGINFPDLRDIFDNDLINVLRIMLHKGDNVILCINMNEDKRAVGNWLKN